MINIRKFFTYLKNNKHLVVFVLALLVTILATIYFSNTEAFINLQLWANDNLIRFSLFLLIFKIAGIVWPPLPGVVLTLGSIPIIGWAPAFFIDTIGNILGSVIAFCLARIYGDKIIKFFFGKNGLKQLSRFNINPERELEALTLILIFGGSLSEAASYAAGITKVSFKNFLFATIISNVVIGLPMFYLFGIALTGANILLGAIPLLVGVIFFLLLRERYFEIK